LDRNRIAEEVGFSRVPVQEMIAQVERDGIVRSVYHRGAYLERFDPDVVYETYELFGQLTGHLAATAASAMTSELVDELGGLVSALRHAGKEQFKDVWQVALSAVTTSKRQ
jgi:DNA-binding GntR family transcriptional regulator